MYVAHLWSPFSLMGPRTTKDVALPLSTPLKCVDGETVNEVPIPKGTNLIIGVHQCNRNPDVWGADAGEWKPDRWLSPLPPSLVDARIPGVFSHMFVLFTIYSSKVYSQALQYDFPRRQ